MNKVSKFGFAKSVVKVPGMGDSITEGTVLEYKKQIGDFVAQDDIVAVVETDKVQIDLRAPIAGKLEKLFFK